MSKKSLTPPRAAPPQRPSDAALEEKLRNLVMNMRMMEATVAEIQNRIGIVDAAIREFTITDQTIEGLKDLKENDEILVPLGGGSFLKAKLVDVEHILMGVGAGVTLQKDSSNAKANVQAQLSELNKLRQNLEGQFYRAAEQLEAIRGEVGRMAGQGSK